MSECIIMSFGFIWTGKCCQFFYFKSIYSNLLTCNNYRDLEGPHSIFDTFFFATVLDTIGDPKMFAVNPASKELSFSSRAMCIVIPVQQQ